MPAIFGVRVAVLHGGGVLHLRRRLCTRFAYARARKRGIEGRAAELASAHLTVEDRAATMIGQADELKRQQRKRMIERSRDIASRDEVRN